MPAVSWATTYYPLQQYGLVLRFVDIDLDTLNLDLDLVEAAIGPERRRSSPSTCSGTPTTSPGCSAIADARTTCCCSRTTASRSARPVGGKATGTFGQMGTFSAFFSHHIATMEGGVILTDDERCIRC